MKLFYLFIFFLLFLGLTALLFFKEPPVWPDEAYFADIAVNILTEGRMYTLLWDGLIPGVERCACWYPPVFFYSVAGWFKIFGVSIASQRSFSVVLAVAFLAISFFLARLIEKNGKTSWAIVLSFIALFFDFTFLKSTRINRPEILILFFAGASLYFYQKSLRGEKLKILFASLTGFFSSLAFLTHIIGLFVFLAIFVSSLTIYKFKLKNINFFMNILSFLLPIFVWIVLFYDNLSIVKAQISLIAIRKSIDRVWLVELLQTQPLALNFLYVAYLLTTILFFVFVVKDKGSKYVPLAFILIFAWAFSIFGKQFWYFVLPVPFIYLSLSVMVSGGTGNANKKLLNFLGLFLLGVMFLLNISLNYTVINQQGNGHSYDLLKQEVLKRIPDEKTVLLSSIPDPYYAFAERKNTLYEFPVLHAPKEDYLKLLNKTDYVVYNGLYDSAIFGDFLDRYLQANKEEIEKIGGDSEYKTYVIKLKPNNQRVSP